MKIISTHWFSEMCNTACIGIVVAENEVGERKAYIGSGSGFDETADAKNIAGRGGKFSLALARRIVDELDRGDD